MKHLIIKLPYPTLDEISNILPRTRVVIHRIAIFLGYSMLVTGIVGCISGVFGG